MGENNDNIIVSKTVNLLVNENLEDGNSNNIANNDLNTTNIINNIENTNIASDVSAIENSNINLKAKIQMFKQILILFQTCFQKLVLIYIYQY